MSRRVQIRVALVAVLLCSAAASLNAEDCCDPKSPFRKGEGWADKPATCENLKQWAAKAPDTNERVTMVLTGKLSDVGSNGTLAYLEMCDEKGLRAVCVTYQMNGMVAGDVVTFAGGYRRASKEWIMLDPCLASR